MAGDPAAIRTLAREALDPLFGFVLYRVSGDRHLAEEVVQETLLQAIQRVAAYDPERGGDRIYAWLTGLARNEIRRARAPMHRSVSLDTLWERMDRELLDVFTRLDSEPLGDEVLEREETRTMVNATMSQLPSHYRAALEAKYLDGRSVRDIAQSLGLSEKAVESQLGRARQAFRAAFTSLARNLGIEPAL
jgi:RNA polymerase sigma-70 factor (ECF subfamily)